MNIKGTFSVSYRHDCISIRVHDQASGIEFVDAVISHEEFARALGSLQYRPFIECEVLGLEYVGKKRVTEQRSIVCPLNSYKREELSAWLAENADEDGWLVSTYLGSKGSVSRDNGITTLNYSVTKYVEEA